MYVDVLNMYVKVLRDAPATILKGIKVLWNLFELL